MAMPGDRPITGSIRYCFRQKATEQWQPYVLKAKQISCLQNSTRFFKTAARLALILLVNDTT